MSPDSENFIIGVFQTNFRAVPRQRYCPFLWPAHDSVPASQRQAAFYKIPDNKSGSYNE
jgi:hypothetical protein